MPEYIKKNWFITLLFLSPLLAWPWPELGSYKGPLRANLINKIAVTLIFFMNGITLNKNLIFSAASKTKALIAIQSLCFLAAPIFAYAFTKTYFKLYTFPQGFITGTYILACLPTTIASCAILTEMTGGNKAISLFNALLSNTLGVIIAPLLLKTLISQNDSLLNFNIKPMVTELIVLIVIPMCLGFVTHIKFPLSQKYQKYFTPISKTLLLFIVYSAFCNTIVEAKAIPSPWDEILLLFLGMGILHIWYLFLAWATGKYFFDNKGETLAILFTAPQKTVAVGIPMCIALLSETGSMQTLGFTTLPLLLYNNVQWIAAGILSHYLSNRKRPT
ncbi:MAG: bile acid:sodium symporter [Chlamydiota bacterium]|nr:bile acid:sodium symporter [Chlamydiota bacterium]